jgi:hypothetical protein
MASCIPVRRSERGQVTDQQVAKSERAVDLGAALQEADRFDEVSQPKHDDADSDEGVRQTIRMVLRLGRVQRFASLGDCCLEGAEFGERLG